MDNTSRALWVTLTNLAALNNGSNPDKLGKSIGHQFLAYTPEQFTYDADGSLTQDGHWIYGWDGENRLASLTPSTSVGPQISLKFDYDSQGRRIRKQVWNGPNWTGTATNDLRFVYDGWNLVGILNSSFSLQTSFTWGLDLSGSTQGAGGIGGLLEINDPVNGVQFPANDGNGNVAALVKGADGTISAQYDYGPFGEVIRATGPMARANPFRFSTQYQDDETDLLMYAHRPYSASQGRFLSHDPLDELSFRTRYIASLKLKERLAVLGRKEDGNEFNFVQNEPVGHFDVLGLCPSGTCDKWTVTIILMRSVDIGVGFLDLRAKLTADKSCCINPHESYYRYLGGGLGVGYDNTLNYRIGSAKFTTDCIPWKAHNGFGRVTGAGVGIGVTYGLTYLAMPQGYVSVASPSYGFDLSIFTTVGRWWLESTPVE
jgi:RHS repeat-associated protein